MKQGYISLRVICPMYKCETRRRISCRNLSDMHLHITFTLDEQKRAHKEKYCHCNFGQCPLYKAMIE